MKSRCLFRLLLAGATSAAGVASATPVAASVTYDPHTMTGFVGRAEVRSAFGWTDQMLASRASGLVFDHDFWTDDTYSVTCGGAAFPVVHHQAYGYFELTDTLDRDGRGGTVTGYRGKLIGFRLTGAHSGISGTTVPPAAGQPCPDHQGATIDQVQLMSTSTGWALRVDSGGVSHRLLVEPKPPAAGQLTSRSAGASA